MLPWQLLNRTVLTLLSPPLFYLQPLQAFPSLDEEQLGGLIPGKGGMVLTKLNNRALVYSLDGGNPLFFDPDGRGGLLPTVGGRLVCFSHFAVPRRAATCAGALQASRGL